MNNIKSKIKTRAKLSEWQPMNKYPTIPGVYEILLIPENTIFYSYWTGKYFGTISYSLEGASLHEKKIRSSLIYKYNHKGYNKFWRGKL